jgi:hypothetical protein
MAGAPQPSTISLPVIAMLGLCLFLTGIASAAVAPYRGQPRLPGAQKRSRQLTQNRLRFRFTPDLG